MFWLGFFVPSYSVLMFLYLLTTSSQFSSWICLKCFVSLSYFPNCYSCPIIFNTRSLKPHSLLKSFGTLLLKYGTSFPAVISATLKYSLLVFAQYLESWRCISWAVVLSCVYWVSRTVPRTLSGWCLIVFESMNKFRFKKKTHKNHFNQIQWHK